MAVSEEIWEAKRDGAAYDGDSLRLGYFSGTPSHNNDFASIAPELRQVLLDDRRVGLVVAGYLELPQILNEFLQGGRIEHHPLQNYLNLQALIAGCDVNLIPLIVNDFTGAKSELKYFEASIVGTPSVASRTRVFGSAIVDGVDGYVAQAGDWQDRIGRILDGVPVSDMARAARATATERHSVEATRITLSEAIEQIAG
jgi:glycosyltransferase involved in cell wall biosynthesis